MPYAIKIIDIWGEGTGDMFVVDSATQKIKMFLSKDEAESEAIIWRKPQNEHKVVVVEI